MLFDEVRGKFCQYVRHTVIVDMTTQATFGDATKRYRSLPIATEDFLIYLLLKCLYRAQRFTLTTTHGLQEKTGGVFVWSVIASKWKIQ